jgi:hypothetical protein
MTLVEKASLIARLAAVTGHALREHLPGYVDPVAIEEVPRSAASLTPEWLTQALCLDHPGAVVRAVRLWAGSDGTTCRREIRVEYNEAGERAGLPNEVFTKTTATLKSRLTTGLANMAAGECLFYTKVRPTLQFDSPEGYFAAYDARTLRSMLLIENVAVTRGATFGAAVRPATREEAESMVGQMAIYHAAYWDDPRLQTDLAQLPTAEAFVHGMAKMINFEKRSLIGVDRATDIIPSEIVRRRSELWPAFMRSLSLHRSRPHTLLHQDTHPGNWFRPGSGKMALHDWQGVAKGLWAADYGYAITSGLRAEDRRAWEEDLLRLYLARLADAGAPAPSFDTAWLEYRREQLHGLFFWLFPMGAGRLQPDMQPIEETRTNVERAACAVADLGTLDLLAA